MLYHKKNASSLYSIIYFVFLKIQDKKVVITTICSERCLLKLSPFEGSVTITYRPLWRHQSHYLPVTQVIIPQQLFHHVLHSHKPAGYCFVNEGCVWPGKQKAEPGWSDRFAGTQGKTNL